MTTTQRPARAGTTPAVSAAESDVRFPIDRALLDRARELGPLIREHAETAERDRRLARAVIEAMTNAGLCRMLTPRSLGGLEADPVTVARVAEEVARFDSAAGWLLQAGNTGAWWSARLPAEGAAEVFANGPTVIHAASFHPPQQAVEVPGGYRVTGRGPLASNIHDAEWVFLSAMVMDGGQPRMTNGMPEVIAVTLRAREVEIIDTWDSLGMRGTDSNDVAVTDVFVPASRAFRLVPGLEPGPQFQGPLYRLPAIASVVVIVAPVALAIAHGAIAELRDLAQRKTPFGSTKGLRERTAVQATLARAEAILRSARLFFYDTLGATWQRALAGEPSTLEQKADLQLGASHAASSAATVTEMMHRLAGTTGIYRRSRLERLFRDAQTIRHHGFVAESRFEAVGQIYLGVPPEFALIAF